MRLHTIASVLLLALLPGMGPFVGFVPAKKSQLQYQSIPQDPHPAASGRPGLHGFPLPHAALHLYLPFQNIHHAAHGDLCNDCLPLEGRDHVFNLLLSRQA